MRVSVLLPALCADVAISINLPFPYITNPLHCNCTHASWPTTPSFRVCEKHTDIFHLSSGFSKNQAAHKNKPKPWWHNKKDVSGVWSRLVTCLCSHSFSSFCFMAAWSNLTPIKLISYSQTPAATKILLDPSCTVRRTYTIIICHTDRL